MTVDAFAKEAGFKIIALPSPDKEIEGAYIGDLLSWVMGRAEENCAWITIMSNVNVVAVASLADVACVILAEGVVLPDDARATASQKGINVFSSKKTAYELAIAMSELLK